MTISKKARSFISRKIRRLRHEGCGEQESIAIAYAMARHEGYKVPKKK